MDRFARIMALHGLLAGRRTALSKQRIQEELECSEATAKRAVRDLRDTLGAPVVWDRDAGGYRYGEADGAHRWDLPGLWFTARELHALTAIDHFLAELAPGLIGPHIAPLQQRIDALLGRCGQDENGNLHRRIRVLHMAARPTRDATFQPVAAALLTRHRLRFDYRHDSGRVVSPQRLVHYRDNWYLDAWCHRRNALRTFALSRMQAVAIIERGADEIGDSLLQAHFTSGYGIFAGRADKEAVLRFSGATAERVAEEQWHPEQRQRTLPDGRYELRVPYRDPRELILDILRHGRDVEVVSPLDLREEVHRRHKEAAALYE